MTAPCLPGLFSESAESRPRPQTEPARLAANAKRVLAYLQALPAGAWATNAELCQPDVGGLRGIGRCHELKRAGWKIEKRHIDRGTWAYRLVRP